LETEIDIPDGQAPLAAFVTDHIKYAEGYPEGHFGPDNRITRAEAVNIVFRLLETGGGDHGYSNIFGDVDPDEWYSNAIAYLAGIGVINGYADGSFKPDNAITRAEFVKILTGFTDSESSGDIAFSDIEGHWAFAHIVDAASRGWIKGYPDGGFRPDNGITRAEAVAIMNRMLGRGILSDDVPDWAQGFTDVSADHWAYAEIAEASVSHLYERLASGSEIWTEEIK
jgi:hypothetical protein